MSTRKRWSTIVAGTAGLFLMGLAVEGPTAAGSTHPESPGPSGAGAESSSYSAVVMADSPAIYWRLGESSGVKAMDSSGNGRNAQYLGSPKLGARSAIIGDPDTAMVLHGPPDTLQWQTHGQSYSGPFSVEAWVRSKVNLQEHTFLSTRASGEYSFDAKLSHAGLTGIRVDVGDGTTQWFATETVPFAWRPHHTYYIAVAATTSDVTVYVDGAAIGTVDYLCGDSCPPPLLYDPTHEVQVGLNSGWPEWFTGRIDEVAVYQYALSAEQVAAHYAAGL
jgi:Concanavalin A-like lectin/glucanases superfamily